MQTNGHASASLGDEPGMSTEPPVDSEGATQAAAVDLAAWASGAAEFPFTDVQRAIDEYMLQAVDDFVKERFPIMPTNPREAVRFLVRENLIAADEAREDVEDV
jgi:hypothetical protein